MPNHSLIHWHLRISKSTSGVIPVVLYYVGPIFLKEDCEMRPPALVRKCCDAEMSTWQTNIWNGPHVRAGPTVLGRCDAGVFCGPRNIVAADGFIAVLKGEIIGVAKGGRRVDARYRHGCC